MRILVTGANGFLGRSVAVRLLELGHSLIGVDRLSRGSWCLDEQAGLDLELHRCDLRDREEVLRIVASSRPDAVVHLAAKHFIPQCERDPAETYATNIGGTANLLAACPPGCRFVLASSAAVYAPSDSEHREDDPLGPVDIYGHSKLAAEEVVRRFQHATGREAAIVRIFNVVGDADGSARVLPEILAALRAGDHVLRLGNVDPKRDFIHVHDVAEGVARIATLPFPAGSRLETINLGSGREYSVQELVDQLAALVGRPLAIETDWAKVRPNDRPHLYAAIDRARDRFGWVPSMDMETMLRRLLHCAPPAESHPVQRPVPTVERLRSAQA